MQGQMPLFAPMQIRHCIYLLSFRCSDIKRKKLEKGELVYVNFEEKGSYYFPPDYKEEFRTVMRMTSASSKQIENKKK